MNTVEHIIDLDLPEDKRWEFLTSYTQEINELMQCYLNDFEGADFIFENISVYRDSVIPESYQKEIAFIASICNYTPEQVLIANLYYDILKFYFGCTAFAIHSEGNMLHARNLDWHTDNNLLSKYSMILNFQQGGNTVFKTVGWPGFIGALSGFKPGGFSVTLNAVLSNDTPEIAAPVSFLLRDVLFNCTSYDDAKEMLEKTTIAGDCLLLLAGTHPNEMVVIERTPTRVAMREAENGYITVTNDYKVLQNNAEEKGILQTTSCGRYDRTQAILSENPPNNSQECLAVLGDNHIMMGITVQQMVFNNTKGEIQFKKTGI